MDKPSDYLIVSGTQEDGRKLRPGDWVERISASLATLDERHRLHYSASVQPCIVDGEKCLAVARCLEQANPSAYGFVMEFARSNNLRVFADRRQDARTLACPTPPPNAD